MNTRQTLLRRARCRHLAALALAALGAPACFLAWPAGVALWAFAGWLDHEAQLLRQATE